MALLGGLLGGAATWLIFNGYTVSTLSSNFSQVMFQFKVSPDLLWNGLKWALGIGLVGGCSRPCARRGCRSRRRCGGLILVTA